MEIKEYLMTVASAASAGICADILNDAFCSRRKGMEKYIKFGITVCIVGVMVIPIVKLVLKTDVDFTENYPDFAENICDTEKDSMYILERECAENLETVIKEKTGIVPCEIRIEMTYQNEVPSITRTVIVLDKSDAAFCENVKQISHEALGVSADVLLKENDEEPCG